MAQANKPVLVVFTGGTIGSKEIGGKLAPATFKTFQENFNQKVRPALDGVSILLIESGINKDSAEITHDDWNVLSKLVVHHHKESNAIVIAHGTDTMAITAAILSHMLSGKLSCPVVLTGSQLPLVHAKTDAVDNLIDACSVTQITQHKDVLVLFSGRFMLGRACTKIDSLQSDAFRSPNMPCVAKHKQWGWEHIYHEKLEKFKQHRELQVTETVALENTLLSDEEADDLGVFPFGHSRGLHDPSPLPAVVIITLFPGITKDFVMHACSDATGCILRAYGAGNAPQSVTEAVNELYEQFKIVLVVSQCLRGGARSDYEAGIDPVHHAYSLIVLINFVGTSGYLERHDH